jgi:hypothetical protein
VPNKKWNNFAHLIKKGVSQIRKGKIKKHADQQTKKQTKDWYDIEWYKKNIGEIVKTVLM